jgi:hypothetical protein
MSSERYELSEARDLHLINLYGKVGECSLAIDRPFGSTRKWLLGRHDEEHLLKDLGVCRDRLVRCFGCGPALAT